MRLKKGVLIGLVGTLLVILGAILYFVIEVGKENNNEKKDTSKIVENYNIYKTFAEETSSWRSENILGDIFIEEVNENYKDWIEKYSEYKKKLDEHEEKSKELKELCVNKTYNDSDIKSKCDAFVIAYETMVNYYVNDVNNLNKILEEYRSSNTIQNKLDNISDFNKGKYDYVDINDNGEYTGMNENS